MGLDPPAAAAALLGPKLVPQVGCTEQAKGLLMPFTLHLALSDVPLYQLPVTCCLAKNHILYSHLQLFEATDEYNLSFPLSCIPFELISAHGILLPQAEQVS